MESTANNPITYNILYWYQPFEIEPVQTWIIPLDPGRQHVSDPNGY